MGTGAPPVQAERSSAGSASTAEHELIADQDADRPRWAPDGKRFAFLSTKEGGSQVWIADFDGAAGTVTGVHKLTSIATEASGELWSPDGKNILFTSDVYPECDGAPEAEAACNAKKVEEAEQSKVKALIFDHLLYRHWNAYKEGKRSHILVVRVPQTPVAHATGASQRSSDAVCLAISRPATTMRPCSRSAGRTTTPSRPTGKEICYTSNHDKNPAASTNNDLWIVPVNVGAGDSPAQVLAKTKNITADNPASDSTPLYSPDGKLHRLPRPAASGIRERPLPPDALRPQDGREEESDGEFRPLGWDIYLGAGFLTHLFRRRR